MANIGGGRDEDTCVRCNKTDDHPKCQTQNPTTFEWETYHTDCHYELIGDASCHPHCVDNAHAGKNGETMLDHILEYHMKDEAV